MEKEMLVWLGLMVLFIVVEIATVGLTAIWLAGGALGALIVSAAGLGPGWQIAAFIIVSLLLLVFTRPFAKKYINAHHVKTNYEELIGEVVKVTETVDNLEQTGSAVARGMEWTARSEDNGEKLPEGSLAQVVAVSGVKLILKRYEEVEK
ncbi:NfeD family protein [Mediterraneibacter glycyrrhizinilyticus]|nr:NfeD family protein [Mediterraneibacter glycyrrhizinilyticus]MBM6853002.1 NfeD family protein [Mediterraneibacter glycyrrhizinilyticus]